jgi:hypothetical protein
VLLNVCGKWRGTGENQELRLQAVDRELDEILSLLDSVVSDGSVIGGEERPVCPASGRRVFVVIPLLSVAVATGSMVLPSFNDMIVIATILVYGAV